MSAELLRRAVAEMRKRAEAATPGPWGIDERSGRDVTDQWWYEVGVSMPDTRGALILGDNEDDGATAKHVASWHPIVALAVADLLEELAAMSDGEAPDFWGGAWPADALAVARAYLGEQPPAPARAADQPEPVPAHTDGECG